MCLLTCLCSSNLVLPTWKHPHGHINKYTTPKVQQFAKWVGPYFNPLGSMMFLSTFMNWHRGHPPHLKVPQRLHGSPQNATVLLLVTNLSFKESALLYVIRGSFGINWLSTGSILSMCQCFSTICLKALCCLLNVVMILVLAQVWAGSKIFFGPWKSRISLVFSLTFLKAFLRLVGEYPRWSNLPWSFFLPPWKTCFNRSNSFESEGIVCTEWT